MFFNRGSFVKYGVRVVFINKWCKLIKNIVKIIVEVGVLVVYILVNINWVEFV